jgi:hypothetical protein
MSTRRRLFLVIRVGIALVVLSLSMGRGIVLPRISFAQAEEDWSEPVLLSTTTDHSWFADLVVDGQGRVHVVWDSGIPALGLEEPGMSMTMHAVREVDGTWSEPNDIAVGSDAEVSRPAIALDRLGVLHMVFRPSGDLHYSQVDAEDAHIASAWRSPYLLDHGPPNYRPDIALDSQGVIHVVWYESVPVNLSEEEIFRTERATHLSDIFYRRSTDDGRTWSPPMNLSHTPNVGSGRVQIEIDTQDGIHVTWEEGWDRNAQNDVAGADPVCGMYIHSRDGGQTWSAPEVFDMPQTATLRFPDAYSRYETGLRQLVSRFDRQHPRYSEVLVYLKWLTDNILQTQQAEEDQTSGDVLVVLAAERALAGLESERTAILARLDELASSVLGISFDELCDLDAATAEQELLEPLPQADNTQMTLGLDGENGVLLLWRSRELRGLYYAWSEDGGATWETVEQVPGLYARPWNEPYDAYHMATDSRGYIHLVLVGTIQEPTDDRQRIPLGVYHLSWDGETWSEPQLIVSYSIPSIPEYPKIAVGGGNQLHVVWGLRPEGLWAEGQQIWYSELEIDAPPEGLIPTPTSTPASTAVPTPAFVRTATPLPTVNPGSSSIPSGLYTERDDLARLALALSPVLLVVLVAAIKKIRR